MKLKEIIDNLQVKKVLGETDISISGVKINSKELKKGDLYICLQGNNFDGHDYAIEAKRYGAVALLCERELEVDLPQIIVSDTRYAMSKVASVFYKNPSKKMKIIGVTGTNGKTTVTHLIKKILESAGKKVGLIGTLGVFFGNTFLEPTLTTPDPLYLHKILAEMYGYGIDYVVMEVSAHASALNKINDISFEVGVFTNFSQDHLDFFNDMETYKKAKLKFINHDRCKYIVTNVDDEVGKSIIEDKNTYTYGCFNPSDVFAVNVAQSQNGTSFVLNIFDDLYDINTKLIGQFNVYNIMSAISTALLLGVKK